MSSPQFYDAFVTYQIESGINDRIYHLYKKLQKTGLKNDTSVLEIGCGIGALTYLLSKKIKQGTIEAIDISPRSIAYAQKHINQPNIHFSVADVSDYTCTIKAYDKILLFDVLEHIPLEVHEKVFKKLVDHMHDDSHLMINLPNPQYILYDQQHNPETLQELDQPVYLSPLLSVFEKLALEMIFFDTYSVWVKNDYQFILIKKRTAFKEEFLSHKRSFIEKATVKLKCTFRKIIYRFP